MIQAAEFCPATPEEDQAAAEVFKRQVEEVEKRQFEDYLKLAEV